MRASSRTLFATAILVTLLCALPEGGIAQSTPSEAGARDRSPAGMAAGGTVPERADSESAGREELLPPSHDWRNGRFHRRGLHGRDLRGRGLHPDRRGWHPDRRGWRAPSPEILAFRLLASAEHPGFLRDGRALRHRTDFHGRARLHGRAGFHGRDGFHGRGGFHHGFRSPTMDPEARRVELLGEAILLRLLLEGRDGLNAALTELLAPPAVRQRPR